MNSIPRDSNAVDPVARTEALPALEPFEVMYGVPEPEESDQNLEPHPNPTMLDGIWEKRPWHMLKVNCIRYLHGAGAAVQAAFRRRT